MLDVERKWRFLVYLISSYVECHHSASPVHLVMYYIEQTRNANPHI